jgi:hypothetical protein
MRSGHSFPPLRAGLVMYLTRNLTPEASGALQSDQSETIHGSGTEKNTFILHVKVKVLCQVQCHKHFFNILRTLLDCLCLPKNMYISFHSSVYYILFQLLHK